MPWLAGAAFTALRPLRIGPPQDDDVKVVERFLIGAETDPHRLNNALSAMETREAAPALPPDARGALVDSVQRFFDLLAQAYEALHGDVRAGQPHAVETLLAVWEPRLDEAAQEIAERTSVLVGSGARKPAKRPPRRHRDHAGLALLFVVIALATAAGVMWLVLQGWPMEAVGLGL